MKITTDRDTIIFELWADKHMSFAQIAKLPHMSTLSIQRIRNIVYGGPHRLKSDHEKAIYRVFRLKFLETQIINASIWYVYENQPDRIITEIAVRKIISRILNKKKVTNI